MTLSRADVLAILERWRGGAMKAAEVLRWAGAHWTRDDVLFDDQHDGFSRTREFLFHLDLLGVHLLTPQDISTIADWLTAPIDDQQACERLTEYIAAIDRPARRRQLKNDPFYRPFCG